MTTYRYKGQTKDGTAVSGVIRAYDEFEAASRLRETVCRYHPAGGGTGEEGKHLQPPHRPEDQGKGAGPDLLPSFSPLSSPQGCPFSTVWRWWRPRPGTATSARCWRRWPRRWAQATPWPRALKTTPRTSPKTFIETVRAGEQSGTLEECFQRLHRYYDKSAKTKAKVVSTLTYPAMVIVVAIVVFIIIIAVAVPAFNDVFAEMDTQLPGITRVLLATSDFFVGWWWLLLLIAAGLGIAYMVARRSVQGRKAIAAWSLTKAPPPTPQPQRRRTVRPQHGHHADGPVCRSPRLWM